MQLVNWRGAAAPRPSRRRSDAFLALPPETTSSSSSLLGFFYLEFQWLCLRERNRELCDEEGYRSMFWLVFGTRVSMISQVSFLSIWRFFERDFPVMKNGRFLLQRRGQVITRRRDGESRVW